MFTAQKLQDFCSVQRLDKIKVEGCIMRLKHCEPYQFDRPIVVIMCYQTTIARSGWTAIMPETTEEK